MAGIAGILKKGEKNLVESMLKRISHRGNYGYRVFTLDDATIGMVWSEHEDEKVQQNARKLTFLDGPGFGHAAGLTHIGTHWQFQRDELGVAPLYLATSEDDSILFASEVKAFLPDYPGITEMPPAHILNNEGIKPYYTLRKGLNDQHDPLAVAGKLKTTLESAVRKRIHCNTMGAWLSGGLDSSTIAALARPHLKSLHTFAGGLENAPDLYHARNVASFIGSIHHEVILTMEKILKILPDVIYQVESFDALLVRSSIINLAVAMEASDYVSEVFSGEGGDELFAGYAYLKDIPPFMLDEELISITNALHNTALQRVDRSASSFGTTAHLIFTDPEVIEFAMGIPIELKIKNEMEKWILRKAMTNMLPESVLNRTKSKFWEGAGIGTLLWDHAARNITDSDFLKERNLANGWTLNTKEELLFYRIFKEHFGELQQLDWMGRSKGSPKFENIGNNMAKIESKASNN